MINGDCGCSSDQVDLMFKKAEQFIDEQIADRTPVLRRHWVDLYPVKPFADGVGINLSKTRFFGDIGPQYDGYDGWRQVQISRPAADAAACGENDGCGYVWEEVGHGMESVEYTLMQRDLRTRPICVKDIRTFWQYKQYQELIFKNLTNISANMREQLNRNAAMTFAIKHIALPNLPTAGDPHQFPVIPTGIEVGKFNYRLALSLYHDFAQEAAGYELATVNGMPAFGLSASPETFHDMIMNDPELRLDLRYCADKSCDLFTKYNILDGMGPFIFLPDLNAPRYDRDATGKLYRVFPYDRTMPIEVGTRPITNDDYHNAEFEYVQFITKDLFALRTRRPLSTVGGESNFDAEVGMFQWKWHNPECKEDPYRRVGRYVTTAEVGIEPGDFVDTRGILIKRKPGHYGIEYWGAEVCPPDVVDCDNVLAEEACPCPAIIDISTAVNPLHLVFTFDRAVPGILNDDIQIETVNGTFITGNIEEVNPTNTVMRLSFAVAPCAEPNAYVGVYCADLTFCDSPVIKTETTLASANHYVLHLTRPIRAATVAQVVTLIMGDGSQLDVPIFAVNTQKLEWTVTLTPAQYYAAKGICAICVPTATAATCPSCVASSLIPCE